MAMEIQGGYSDYRTSQAEALKAAQERKADQKPEEKEEGAAFQDPWKKKDEYIKSEQCTGNTDRVDSEIEKLKEKEKQLKQQIRAASDEKEAKKLQKELAQVENELSQKDNDSYRRANTVFS